MIQYPIYCDSTLPPQKILYTSPRHKIWEPLPLNLQNAFYAPLTTLNFHLESFFFSFPFLPRELIELSEKRDPQYSKSTLLKPSLSEMKSIEKEKGEKKVGIHPRTK